MTLDEARECAGRSVIYTAGGRHREEGIITGTSNRYVFVRYGQDRTAKATDPAMLTLNDDDDSMAECDGLCVTAADLGVPGYVVAYPHPGCPLHAPGEECQCGQPDRCLSPTHGQVSMGEALAIRHRQENGS